MMLRQLYAHLEQLDFQKVRDHNKNPNPTILTNQIIISIDLGVCLSHAALLDAAAYFDVMGPNDVILCFSSLYWVTGWMMLLGGMINGSTRIITTEPHSVERHLRLVEQYRVTFALSSPSHLTLLAKSDRLKQADLSSLKYQLFAGGKCPSFAQTEINSHLPNGRIHPNYGLSEAAWSITMNLSGSDSVGQLLHPYTMKIIDDDGNRCGIGEDGEICFKANYRFLGYYGDQKATDEAYDKEGFFLSGDIGHFDEAGDLFIVDRKKDIIKYGGFQISPSQIESYLAKSSGIKSACVIGMPDDVMLELPAAFIVRNGESKISENDVFDLVTGSFIDLKTKTTSLNNVSFVFLNTRPFRRLLQASWRCILR